MKKILLALIAVVAMGMSANAQRMNVSASYGGYTLMDACNYHDGWHGVNTAWGAVNLSFNAKVLPKFWLGASYTYSSATTKGPESSKVGYNVIMLNGRYDYYKNSLLTVYGHLGMGVDISHMMPKHGDAYNKAYFAFQASPIGVDVPLSRAFTMFGEAGFGAQGLLQVGFRLNL